MRTRCTRLARLSRGDPVDDPPSSISDGRNSTRTRLEGREREKRSDGWVEAGVQEAAAAMEAARRRSLEEEVERLGL